MPLKFLTQTSHTSSKIQYKPQDKWTLFHYWTSIYFLVASLL